MLVPRRERRAFWSGEVIALDVVLASGGREIALVAAQEEFVRPSRMLVAEPC